MAKTSIQGWREEFLRGYSKAVEATAGEAAPGNEQATQQRVARQPRDAPRPLGSGWHVTLCDIHSILFSICSLALKI